MDEMEKNQEFIAELVERARAAQRVAEGFSQRRVDELAAAIVYTLSRPELAKSIAEQALEETHMGRIDSKMSKLTAKMPAILYDVLSTKTVGIVDRIPGEGNREAGKARWCYRGTDSQHQSGSNACFQGGSKPACPQCRDLCTASQQQGNHHPGSLMITPTLLPIASRIGVSYLEVGLIMVVNTSVGMLTPPMALNILIAAGIGNETIERIAKKVIPFLLVLILDIFIITYVPGFITWLPKTLGMTI